MAKYLITLMILSLLIAGCGPDGNSSTHPNNDVAYSAEYDCSANDSKSTYKTVNGTSGCYGAPQAAPVPSGFPLQLIYSDASYERYTTLYDNCIVAKGQIVAGANKVTSVCTNAYLPVLDYEKELAFCACPNGDAGKVLCFDGVNTCR